MMTLLYKEIRLCAHPTSVVFAFLGCLVLVPAFLPEPGERGKDYTTELANLMAQVFRVSEGRALGLFTS